MKRLIGFSHRVAYAMAIAVVGLLLAALPGGASVDPSGLFTKALNLPLAAAGDRARNLITAFPGL
jgi:hypothetical protein